jgi:ferredoxin
MNEVFVKFEGTDREGIIAVGSYLIDAAKRLGADIDCDCGTEEESNACTVKILAGLELLSKPTSAEMEQLTDSERNSRQRLACQTKLEKPGELVVMTVKKKESKEKTAESGQSAEDFKKEFEELPLNEKFASLMELEAIALGETFSFILNSPYEAFGKVMDVMAGFGRDLEKKDREAKTPKDHKEPKKAAKKRAPRKTASRRKKAATDQGKNASKSSPKKKASENSEEPEKGDKEASE